MDTKLFFIVVLLLVDHGTPYFAEHPKSGGGGYGVERYWETSGSQVEDSGVGGYGLALEARARPRRQATALALPATILGGIFDSSMGMLGGVMQYFLPGSNALVKLIESFTMRVFSIMARPILFTARMLGGPIERMANTMLDKTKELAVKYSVKIALWGLNKTKEALPYLDEWAVEFAKRPDISDAARSALNTAHAIYRLLNMFGFLKVT